MQGVGVRVWGVGCWVKGLGFRSCHLEDADGEAVNNRLGECNGNLFKV